MVVAEVMEEVARFYEGAQHSRDGAKPWIRQAKPALVGSQLKTCPIAFRRIKMIWNLSRNIMASIHGKLAQFTFYIPRRFSFLLILFTELYLAAAYPPCHIVDDTAVNCCPTTSSTHTDDELAGGEEDHGRWRLLAEGHGDDDHHEEELCEATFAVFESTPTGCDEHKNHAVHMAEEVLFFFTISILATFMIELLVLMAALTPRIFFKQAFYVLDLFVVAGSLALELSFHIVSEDTLASLSGILVLARIWRFLRIGHGLVEATHEYAAMRHHTLEHYASECEKLLLKHGIPLPKDGPMFEVSVEPDVPPVIQEETSEEIIQEDGGAQYENGVKVENGAAKEDP